MGNANANGKKQGKKAKRLPEIVTGGILAVLVLLVLVMDFAKPITYTMYNSGSIHYEKGKVEAVVSEQIQPAPGMPDWSVGNQKIRVRMQNGAQAGQEILFDNNLSTTHSIRVKKGQAVIVKADRPKGVAPFYTLYNYDRTPGLLAIAVVFFLFMVAVGRFKGLRSVLGLGISLFFVLAFLLPAIYHGQSPVLMSILTVILTAAFSLLLLNGFSRKTLTAVLATAAGVVLAALFFWLLAAMVHLFGYNLAEAEELIIIAQHTGLQIGQVMFAGVLISSMGAVMDITMSIASALFEMKEVQPGMRPRSVFGSGMHIGRDMIGTMCQTLIMAFVGSSLATLLVTISYGTHFDQLMSSDYVAIEVVQAVSGSLAVIVAVPVTAALCALSDTFRKAPPKSAGPAAVRKSRKIRRPQV